MAEVATPPATYTQSPRAGRFAHLYQPQSHKSSTQSDAVDHSTQADYFTSGSRKRLRAESSLVNGSNDRQTSSRYYSQRQTPTRDDDSSVIFSTESLLVNDQYALKGGFDTPGLLANTDSYRVDSVDDADTRRKMRDLDLNVHSTEPAFAGPLARERNGFGRPQIDFTSYSSDQTYHKSSPSWTRLALTLPFSIAGKMFSFGGAVLKGFYAGGGQGYQIDENGNTTSYSTPSASRLQTRPSLAPGTPVPGAWRDSPPNAYGNDHDAFEGDFEQDNPQSARPPPNKRRLTDKDSWVMVGTPDMDAATPTSPRRSMHTTTTPRLSRPSSALRTASRRSMLSASRRQSYVTTSTGSPSINHAFSPQHHTAKVHLGSHSRQHSFGRQSSPSHSTVGNTAPMSPDTEKLKRRQAKQERAADRTMSNMSRQLEELIRQGQEALGTRFSVEGHGDADDDEAFVDED